MAVNLLLEAEIKIIQTVLDHINIFATPGSSDVGILDAWSSLLLYHGDTHGTPAVSRVLLLAIKSK
jgi:hypothetical protein